MPRKKVKFEVVRLSPAMDTKRLLLQCRLALGRDEFGRMYPQYAVVHKALAEMLARMEGGTRQPDTQ